MEELKWLKTKLCYIVLPGRNYLIHSRNRHLQTIVRPMKSRYYMNNVFLLVLMADLFCTVCSLNARNTQLLFL